MCVLDVTDRGSTCFKLVLVCALLLFRRKYKAGSAGFVLTAQETIVLGIHVLHTGELLLALKLPCVDTHRLSNHIILSLCNPDPDVCVCVVIRCTPVF